MVGQLYEHWEQMGNFHDNQMGFRRDRSAGALINSLRNFYYEDCNFMRTLLLTDMSNALGAQGHNEILTDLNPLVNLNASKLICSF